MYKLTRTLPRGAAGNEITLIFETQSRWVSIDACLGSKFNCLVSGSAVISCADDHSDGRSPDPETTLRSNLNTDAGSRSHAHVRP